MFFEKTTWRNFLTQFRAVTRQLVKDNEKLITEHVEWLGKMKELHEEKEMIKKLARTQAQELKDAWDTSIAWEIKYKEAEAARKLLADGVKIQPGSIKAVSMIKSTDDTDAHAGTWSVCIFTLDPAGTKVLARVQGPDCPREFALDNLKIAVMQEFDPEALN